MAEAPAKKPSARSGILAGGIRTLLDSHDREQVLTLQTIVIVLAIVVCALGIFAAGKGYARLGTLGASLLIFLAGAAGGGVAGFLFGVPRALQTSQASGVNTNLDQISDWLTKILVGVGLTQLADLPRYSWKVAGRLATLFPDPSVAWAQPAAFSIAVIGVILGFLGVYLMTRLILSAAFAKADRRASDIQNAIPAASKPIVEEMGEMIDGATIAKLAAIEQGAAPALASLREFLKARDSADRRKEEEAVARMLFKRWILEGSRTSEELKALRRELT